MLATIHFRTLCLFVCCLKTLRIKIQKNITILGAVLYGSQAWSPTLREEHRLRVFENRVLRRILEPKRDEITGDWKNCIMRTFITCTVPQIIIRMIKSTRMRCAGHVARKVQNRNGYRVYTEANFRVLSCYNILVYVLDLISVRWLWIVRSSGLQDRVVRRQRLSDEYTVSFFRVEK
jgi:hypothetical protein